MTVNPQWTTLIVVVLLFVLSVRFGYLLFLGAELLCDLSFALILALCVLID